MGRSWKWSILILSKKSQKKPLKNHILQFFLIFHFNGNGKYIPASLHAKIFKSVFVTW